MKCSYVSMGIVLLLVFLTAGLVYQQYKHEPFVVASNASIPLVNAGSEPWKHHEVNSIAYLQLRPAFQRGLRHHMNASYFEVDNYTFEMELQKIFRQSCQQMAFRPKEWLSEIQPESFNVAPSMLKEYTNVLEYVKTTINTSKVLRGTQIVHDRWVSFRNHAKQKLKTLMRVELILYRAGKFQGKHVTMSVVIDASTKDPRTKYTVIQTKVEGVVSEDAIGMFPVVATDDTASNYVNVPTDPLKNYDAVLLDKKTIDKTIKTQREKLDRNLAAQLLVI